MSIHENLSDNILHCRTSCRLSPLTRTLNSTFVFHFRYGRTSQQRAHCELKTSLHPFTRPEMNRFRNRIMNPYGCCGTTKGCRTHSSTATKSQFQRICRTTLPIWTACSDRTTSRARRISCNVVSRPRGSSRQGLRFTIVYTGSSTWEDSDRSARSGSIASKT